MRSNPEVFCALLCSTVLPLPEGGRQDSAESPEREDGRSLEENYKDEKSSPESAEMPLQKMSATQDPLVTAPPKDSKDDEANSTTAKPAMPNILPKADHFDMPMKTAPVPASVQETGRTNSEFWAFFILCKLGCFFKSLNLFEKRHSKTQFTKILGITPLPNNTEHFNEAF